MNANDPNNSKIKIVPYRGLANQNSIIIRGHLFKKHRVKDVKEHHKHFYNLKQAIRRYQASPLKNTRLSVSVDGLRKEIITDRRGYFFTEIRDHSLSRGWHDFRISYNDTIYAHGELYFPQPQSTAVISDIDDTVLISHSTRFHKKLNLLLFRNAHSRKPIPLIKNWFDHLHELNKNIEPKDFFYVSNSEWNLYDFIEDFFHINDLPKGVFFLQKFKKGLKDLLHSGKVNDDHKMESIQFLLDFYPEKSFILVGDNGQKDVEIYSHVCENYASRIKGVMIRKLPYVKEHYRIENLEKRLDELNVPFTVYH